VYVDELKETFPGRIHTYLNCLLNRGHQSFDMRETHVAFLTFM